MKLPINKRVVVIYPDGVQPTMWSKYYSTIDVREACTKDNCEYTDEHYFYDGQVFHQGVRLRLDQTQGKEGM